MIDVAVSGGDVMLNLCYENRDFIAFKGIDVKTSLQIV